MILTGERHAEHLFTGQNTQQMRLKSVLVKYEKYGTLSMYVFRQASLSPINSDLIGQQF